MGFSNQWVYHKNFDNMTGESDPYIENVYGSKGGSLLVWYKNDWIQHGTTEYIGNSGCAGDIIIKFDDDPSITEHGSGSSGKSSFITSGNTFYIDLMKTKKVMSIRSYSYDCGNVTEKFSLVGFTSAYNLMVAPYIRQQKIIQDSLLIEQNKQDSISHFNDSIQHIQDSISCANEAIQHTQDSIIQHKQDSIKFVQDSIQAYKDSLLHAEKLQQYVNDSINIAKSHKWKYWGRNYRGFFAGGYSYNGSNIANSNGGIISFGILSKNGFSWCQSLSLAGSKLNADVSLDFEGDYYHSPYSSYTYTKLLSYDNYVAFGYKGIMVDMGFLWDTYSVNEEYTWHNSYYDSSYDDYSTSEYYFGFSIGGKIVEPIGARGILGVGCGARFISNQCGLYANISIGIIAPKGEYMLSKYNYLY